MSLEQADSLILLGQQSVHLLQWCAAFLAGLLLYKIGRG